MQGGTGTVVGRCLGLGTRFALRRRDMPTKGARVPAWDFFFGRRSPNARLPGGPVFGAMLGAVFGQQCQLGRRVSCQPRQGGISCHAMGGTFLYEPIFFCSNPSSHAWRLLLNASGWHTVQTSLPVGVTLFCGRSTQERACSTGLASFFFFLLFFFRNFSLKLSINVGFHLHASPGLIAARAEGRPNGCSPAQAIQADATARG